MTIADSVKRPLHVRHAFVVDDERLVRALESAGGRMKAKPPFI